MASPQQQRHSGDSRTNRTTQKVYMFRMIGIYLLHEMYILSSETGMPTSASSSAVRYSHTERAKESQEGTGSKRSFRIALISEKMVP